MENALFLAILSSFLITWGIGLGVPLVFRRFIFRKNIQRNNAIIFSVVWYFVQFFVYTSTGTANKTHFPLLIISILTYRILTKNHLFNSRQRGN
jgi:hypothetical protein